jgi:hypothetical protein
MNKRDYTTGTQITDKLKEIGKLVHEMDITFREKEMLLEPLRESLNTFDTWLIQGRYEAESEIYKEKSTFKNLIKYLLK